MNPQADRSLAVKMRDALWQAYASMTTPPADPKRATGDGVCFESRPASPPVDYADSKTGRRGDPVSF